jgi:hypothetical protein
MKLSEYLNDTAQLMNDPTYSFTSQFQMARWVNEARRLVAMKTGCVRRLISGQSAFGAGDQAGFAIPGAAQPGAVPGAFNYGLGGPPASGTGAPVIGASLGPMMTIPNVERYPYAGFFNPYLRQQHAGCDKVNDVIDLAVSWGGVSRPSLDWMPWDDFQAYCRAYALLNTSYPAVWSVMNDGTQGEVWMFPIPSQACDMEADVSCLPSALSDDSTYDVIPETFSDSVKFGAAALCYFQKKQFGNADAMNQMGGSMYLPVQRASADRGKSRSYYPGF